MSGQAERLGSQVWLRDMLQSGEALEIVQAAGVTYAEIGEACGVSKVIAWHWLHGHTQRPRPAHALRLSRLLKQLEVIDRA